ncbi:MAG: hypothetical protein JXA20_07265 [Spirochaetes bacterium]|nr:hypothetical protein [Spirochaetota bacterium]
MSTPVFYADISAQLKCFIERTWSYFGKTGVSADHLPRDRTLIFVMSYGYEEPGVYDGIYERYCRYFRMFGFDRCYLIKAYGSQYHSPEIVNRQGVEELVREIPLRIVGGAEGTVSACPGGGIVWVGRRSLPSGNPRVSAHA